MMRVFSKASLQNLGSITAFVLLLSTVPLTSGVIIVPGRSYLEFTINVCQPIHAFAAVSNIPFARPAVTVPAFAPLCLGSVRANPPARIIECNAEPETPPPKPLA